MTQHPQHEPIAMLNHKTKTQKPQRKTMVMMLNRKTRYNRYNPHDDKTAEASSGSWHSKHWDCAMEGEHCGDGAFSKDVKGTGKGTWHSSNWLDEDKSIAAGQASIGIVAS